MFASDTSSTLLSAFASLRPVQHNATRFVGIDIGADRVHVASIGRANLRRKNAPNRDAPLEWISNTEFALPIDPAMPATSDLIDLVCRTLEERLPRCVGGERNVATLTLPMPWIHYETTSVAELDHSQTDCDSMFGASVFRSPAKLSHWPVCDSQKQHVIAATAETAACKIAETVASVGYQVQGILPHAVALMHAAKDLTSIDPHSVLLLEWFGGIVATKNANRCGLCRSLPAVDRSESARNYVDELEPWLEVIASEVTATTRYVARLGVHSNPQAPVLIGGSVAQIPGVDEALATMLRRPVATWRYSHRKRPNCTRDANGDAGRLDPSCAVALSLAHCAGSRVSAGGR